MWSVRIVMPQRPYIRENFIRRNYCLTTSSYVDLNISLLLIYTIFLLLTIIIALVWICWMFLLLQVSGLRSINSKHLALVSQVISFICAITPGRWCIYYHVFQCCLSWYCCGESDYITCLVLMILNINALIDVLLQDRFQLSIYPIYLYRLLYIFLHVKCPSPTTRRAVLWLVL